MPPVAPSAYVGGPESSSPPLPARPEIGPLLAEARKVTQRSSLSRGAVGSGSAGRSSSLSGARSVNMVLPNEPLAQATVDRTRAAASVAGSRRPPAKSRQRPTPVHRSKSSASSSRAVRPLSGSTPVESVIERTRSSGTLPHASTAAGMQRDEAERLAARRAASRQATSERHPLLRPVASPTPASADAFGAVPARAALPKEPRVVPAALKPDTSFLLDRPGHGQIPSRGAQTSQIPPSVIPPQHYLVESSPVPPPEVDKYAVEYDSEAKLWHTTVFPALRPSGRRDVLLLERWLNTMLESQRLDNMGPIEVLSQVQDIFSMCFNEIVRQVSVHCVERGRLMHAIWSRYCELFEHLSTITRRDRAQYDAALEELNNDNTVQVRRMKVDATDATSQLMHSCQELNNEILKLQRELASTQEDLKTALRQKEKTKTDFGRIREYLRDAEKKTKEQDRNVARLTRELRETRLERDRIEASFRFQLAMAQRKNNSELAEDEKGMFVNRDLSARLHAQITASLDSLEPHAETNASLTALMETLEDFVDTMDPVRHLGEDEPPDMDAGLETLWEDAEIQTDEARGVDDDDGAGPGQGVTTTASGSRLPDSDAVAEAQRRATHQSKQSQSRGRRRFNDEDFDTMLASLKVGGKQGNVRDVQWASRLLSQLYAEKMQADLADDEEGTPRLALTEFCYDFFLSKFGVKQMAQDLLLDLLTTVERFDTQPKFAVFRRLCSRKMLDQLDFYLFVLHYVESSVGVTTVADDGTAGLAMSAAAAEETAEFVFSDMDASMRATLQMQVERLTIDADTVDIDVFLKLLVDEFDRELRRSNERLRLLFRAGDTNNDSVLSYEEFRELCRHVKASITDRAIMHMFREALQLGANDTNEIPVDVFVKVARAHKLDPVGGTMTREIDREALDLKVRHMFVNDWNTIQPMLKRSIQKLEAIESVPSDVVAKIHDRFKIIEASIANKEEMETTYVYYRMLMSDLNENLQAYAAESLQIVE